MIRQAPLPLLFVLSPTLQPDPATALERSLRKALLRRGSIVVGTPATPYEPRLAENPLRKVLLLEEGREIAITTGTPCILRELDLLVELDRRHSVAVRMIVPVSEAEDPEPRMRAVRGLTAERIATRVLLSPTGSGSKNGEETLRFLLEEALASEALDVEIDVRSLRRGRQDSLLAAFRRLRLEYGFPRSSSGRG